MVPIMLANPPASLRSGRALVLEVSRESHILLSPRRGNDAPWKAWKTQKASFPLFPPRLEIRQTAPDSHISTAPAAGFIFTPLKPSRAPPPLISLTEADGFSHHSCASVAALRS